MNETCFSKLPCLVFVKKNYIPCQLRIKSEPFLVNLKFKSEHLKWDYPYLSTQFDTSNFGKHIESNIQFNEFVDLRCGASKQE
jgi:hypothetical protein